MPCFISFHLKLSCLPASLTSFTLRTNLIVHSQHLQSLQYINVKNDDIYMSGQDL